jgi:hypothetical protein
VTITTHEDHVEPTEGDSESAEDATLDDDYCNEVELLTTVSLERTR